MDKDANTIIDALGGTSKVAEKCDLTVGAISQWRTNGIPKPWKKYLTAEFPEVFGLPSRKRQRSIRSA